MPPDSSSGYSGATSGDNPTWRNFSMAISLAWERFIFLPSIKPNATFSQIFRLSNKAAPWNSIPVFELTFSISFSDSPMISRPSTLIDPDSGTNNPWIHLIVTDFPVPDPPMITSDSPFLTWRSTPSKTTFFPNALWTSVIWTFNSSLIKAPFYFVKNSSVSI